MADGSNIIPLVPTSRERAAEAEVIQLRPGHPQSNVGAHPFPAPEPIIERPRVDITGGLDGCTVWLLGRPYATGLTLSNAARVASALMTLDALDCLPGSEPPSPPQAA